MSWMRTRAGDARERPLRASLEAALDALPPASPKTLDGATLVRMRTCAALGGALARVRSAPAHTDADAERVIIAALLYVTDTLVHDASALHDARWYWQQVHDSPWRAALVWTQTLPQRAAYSVAHRGLRPLCATVHHTRRDAHARMHRLADTYESLAEKLGTLALDWHRGTMPRAVLAQHAAAALDPAHHGADDKPDDALDAAHALLEAIAHHEAHVAEVLSPRECGIPSVLMRVWPVAVAYPVLAYIVARAVSTHWRTLVAQARDAGATLRGLVIDWVWEPSMRLLDTLRAGRAERRLIVSRDSLVADEQSLARMVRAFGEDQLHLRGAELDASLARAQNGDLTDVMEHYERDIRAPLRSLLVGGSLIRTVLIQVQKAKVDLEVALNGIDWLLHSQELLIGFAGLAPALVLVYALWRVAARATHALVYGRAAGQAQRSTQEARLEAWEALRQIDALVSEAPRSEARAPAYGHLLLNIDVLRAAFAQLLPATTRKRAVGTCLNDEIERDLCALELAGQSAVFAGNDTAWQRRQATIERMWRSWSWLLAMNRLVP